MSKSTANLPDIPPRDLLACDALPHLKVFTRDQLLFLGRNNLQHLRSVWRTMLRTSRSILNTRQELLSLIEGKSPAELQALVAQYDHPDYPSQNSSHKGERLAPADPSAASRAPGSTTFNICGWCKYAHCYLHPDSHAYVPHETRVFRPSCGLLSDDWQSDYEHNYNYPCPLTHSSPSSDYPGAVCANLHARHDRLLSYHQQVSEYVAHLNALITIAEPKPLFPPYRREKHYPIGTPVYFVYSAFSPCSTIPHPFGWHLEKPKARVSRGTVIGYEPNRYTPSYVLTAFSTDAPNTQPHAIQYDLPWLLSFEELTYLLDHPDFAQIWLTACENDESDVVNAITFYHQHHYLIIEYT